MDKETRYSVDLNEILNAAVEAKNNRIDAVEFKKRVVASGSRGMWWKRSLNLRRSPSG